MGILTRRGLLLCGGSATLLTATRVAAFADSNLVLEGYSSLVLESYRACLSKATSLLEYVDRFCDSATEDNLRVCRNAWVEARHWYGQTEAFRFYGGPIDGVGGPEGRVNAWPVDAAVIDSVSGRPNSGIVNDPSVEISKANLVAQNEAAGETSVTTGWHAIEFLLWGQDFYTDSPGRRPASDYREGGAPNAKRRRQYLRLATEILVADLAWLCNSWLEPTSEFRRRFVQRSSSVAGIFRGLATLVRSELAGERLQVALDTLQQEDEQSCFSDNTSRDFVSSLLGVENVWNGRFVRPDGSSLSVEPLRKWAAAGAAVEARVVDEKLESALVAARSLRSPFDQEIVGGADGLGRVRAEHLLKGLTELAEALELAGLASGARALVTGDQ